MTAVEYILEGLEAELELERELGVRSIEFDRSLLSVPPPKAAPEARPAAAAKASVPLPREAARPQSRDAGKDVQLQSANLARYRQMAEGNRQAPAAGPRVAQPDNPTVLPFVFLHDRPLSPKGVEMMAKIITALGKTAETAPVVVAPPLVKAKAYVVLGALALRKYFPSLKGEPGQWLKTESGEDVLVTYSPEYILRFGTVTPAVEKIKRAMWTSLKGVLQRTR